MAMVVEDGTGLSNANSYVSIGEADVYFADRGNTVWEDLDDKDQLLIRATDYTEIRFKSRYKNNQLTTTQSLGHPRNDSKGIQQTLKRAIFEYALRASGGPLMPDITTDASGRQVASSKKVIGPIETEITYIGSSQTAFKSHPVPDGLMAPLLLSTSRLARS